MSAEKTRKEFRIKPLAVEHWGTFYYRCSRDSQVHKAAIKKARKLKIPPGNLILPICHSIWNAYQ